MTLTSRERIIYTYRGTDYLSEDAVRVAIKQKQSLVLPKIVNNWARYKVTLKHIIVPVKEIQNYKQLIREYKNKLAATDYAVIKIAEGVAERDEYEEVLKQRAEWRNKINELESKVGN